VAAGPDQEIDGSAEIVQSPDPATDVDDTASGWIDGGAAPVDDEPSAAVPETEDAVIEPVPREPAEEPVSDVADEVEDPNTIVEPSAEPVALAAPPIEDPTVTTETAPEGIRVDTGDRAKRERPVKLTKPAVQRRVIAAPAPVVAPTTTNAVTVRVASGTNRSTMVRATDGARFHVVQRGESLWSIANDRLGERAAVAQIAHEVDRLWQLNEDRIASGNPDLLYAGTRLRLR
jgi:nucleoid-associated protein YgaU